MTNLQDGAPRITARVVRRVWLWFPIAVGAGLAAALAVTVLTPLWVTLQRDSERLREVEALTARLADERLRARRLVEQEEKVGVQRRNLIRVISGNGDVSTFLAQLDQLAKASGVQLDLYEPTAAAAPATAGTPPPPGAPPKPASPSADPLEAEGLQSHAIVLAARGNFPQLLVFLRQMEALNVLVVQSDLQLNLEAQPGVAAPATANEPVRLKMALKLYSKNTAQTPVKPAASGGAATVEPPN